MDKVVFFWSGWEPIIRILVVGTLTYFSIILLLRTSGKRTLSTMNVFDFIVTVAMGSVFGRVLTAKQVSVAEAFAAFLLLIVLQLVVSFIQARSKWFSNLITSEPTLLYYQNQFLEKNMRKERIRKDSLLANVRKNRINSLEEVEAIVLETDGNISVIKKGSSHPSSSYNQLLN